MKPQDGVAQLYFEMLSIQPIEFDLSFVRTDQVNIVDERYVRSTQYNDSSYTQRGNRAQGNSALTFFVNVLTMAIGNINVSCSCGCWYDLILNKKNELGGSSKIQRFGSRESTRQWP